MLCLGYPSAIGKSSHANKLTIIISHPSLAFSNKISENNFSISTSRGLEALAFEKCSYFITTNKFCSSNIILSLRKKISVYPIDNLPPAFPLKLHSSLNMSSAFCFIYLPRMFFFCMLRHIYTQINEFCQSKTFQNLSEILVLFSRNT